MTTEATESLKRVEAKIFPDQYPESPRTSQDNLTTMVYGHRSYIVGDRAPNAGEVEVLTNGTNGGWDALLDWYLNHHGGGEGLVLWARKYGMIDHSGIAIYLHGGAHPQDPGGWDSGTVGIIFVTEAQRALLGTPLDAVELVALAEFEEYDQHIRGNVWNYEVVEHTKCETCKNETEEVVDSGYGFIGDDDPEKNGMTDTVEAGYRQVLIDAYKKDGVTDGR